MRKEPSSRNVGVLRDRLYAVVLRFPALLALTLTVAGVSFAPGLGLGLVAVYAAMLADFYLRAGVNLFRFWTGNWKTVAARSGVGGD